jgi:DNA repair photolyase
MRRPARPAIRVFALPAVRMVPLRLKQGRAATTAGSFGLQPRAVLDVRQRGTRFVTLAPRTVMNPPSQTGMPFWSLNPYVGCEFGCTYCYARYAHRYVVERAHHAGRLSDTELSEFRGPRGWEAFETRIFVKSQIRTALDADLRRYFRRAPSAPATIVIGTATDPYQPAERRFRLTRTVLERLAGYEGLSVGLITKSGLVTRDVDLFLAIQRTNDLEVHVSLTTLDKALIRALETRSPMPTVRLRALRRLTRAGVNAGLIVAPVLPGITDRRDQLDALFAAAKEAGARFIHASPLRLYAGIRDRFLPVLDDRFPHLANRYRRAYAGRGAAPPAYARALARRIRSLQIRHGFATRDMRDRYEKHAPVPQWEFGFEA